MTWHPTPIKGVWTAERNGKSYLLISFDVPSQTLRGNKKLREPP